MGDKTKIEWATHSFSPWIGCAKVHTGCQNCYAEAMAGRLGVVWGPNGTRRRTAESTWRQVEKWNRAEEPFLSWSNHERPRVFPSLCDPFEDWHGHMLDKNGAMAWNENGGSMAMHDVRRDFFALIDRCPNLDFLLLTKRPENVRRMWPALSQHDGEEEWRVVGRHTGYQVSSIGRVRGPRGKILAFSEKSEYPSVQLGSNENRWNVHVLVAEAFIGPKPFLGAEVRHLDGDPWNNRVVNLKWGTQSENWDDSKRHGTHRRYCKLTPEQVAEIKRRASLQSYASLGIEFGVSATQIRNIAIDAQWQAPNCNPSLSPRSNCWLLYSASDQQTLDAGLPHLLACRDLVPVLGLSLEPLVGPVDLSKAVWSRGELAAANSCGMNWSQLLGWVIVGGESGPRARPMNLAWLQSIADQCSAAGVPLFVKQDSGPKSGQQGRISDKLWALKQFPRKDA